LRADPVVQPGVRQRGRAGHDCDRPGAAGALSVRRGADRATDVAVRSLSVADVCRGESHDAAPVRRPGWRVVLPSLQPDSGARVFAHGGRRGDASVRADHVRAVSMDRRPGEPGWRQAAPGSRAGHGGGGNISVHVTWYWRELLDDVLSGHRAAWD